MKSFLEVFPDLHIADSVKGLLELVQVEKVSAARDRSSIRIYIDSPRLMHRQNIRQLEQGIKDQLFPGKKITIKIVEKYHLSGQYTPKKLMDVYREIKRKALVERLEEIQKCIDYIDRKQGFYDDVLSGKTEYYSNLIKVESQ